MLNHDKSDHLNHREDLTKLQSVLSLSLEKHLNKFNKLFGYEEIQRSKIPNFEPEILTYGYKSFG